MKRATLQNRIKRVAAAALCAVCLAGLCVQSISAATTNDEAVQLEYTNNKYGVGENPDDKKYTAGILSGNSLEVRMNLGQYTLLAGRDALADNYISAVDGLGQPVTGFDNKTNKPYNFSVETTGSGSMYNVGATLKDGVGEARLQIVGNTATLTPRSGYYDGRVDASGQSAAAYMDVQATGNAQVVLSKESRLVLKCLVGQSPNVTSPIFDTVQTGSTGVFEPYVGAKVTINSTALKPAPGSGADKPAASDREITVNLVPATDKDLPTLTLRFKAPAYYDNIPEFTYTDNGDGTVSDVKSTGFYLNEKGEQYKPSEQYLDPPANTQLDPAWRASVRNNYIRGGMTYTVSFSPPQSTALSLTVATPEYVANQLLENIRRNQGASKPGAGGEDGRFISWVGQDSPGLIANNSFTLKCCDERYNAKFYIYWHWVPANASIPGAQDVIKIDQEKTSTEVVAKVQRLEDDVRGSITADITVFDGSTYKSLLKDQVVFPEVVVRGSGIPATTLQMSCTTGATPTKDAPDTFGDDIVTEFNPPKGAELYKELNMDVFAGRVRGYFAAPEGPYEYLLRLNMGMKNAASMFAIVTVDTPDIVELRTREGSGLQLYMPRVASDVYVEQKNYSESDFRRDDHRIYNTGMNSSTEQTLDMVVTAKAKGETKLTVQYFVQIGSYYYVDSTHTTTIKVVDTSPSTDASLSDLTLQASTGDKESFGFGFNPEITEYEEVVQLPYACREYQLRPYINDPKCQHLDVLVTAKDIEGNDVTQTLFADQYVAAQNAAVVKHGQALAMTLDNFSSVYSLVVHVTAQDPSYTRDYRLQVMRMAPSDDDRLASIAFYNEKDKDCTTNLLQNFDPDVNTYVLDVPYGAKRLKVEAQQSFKRALIRYTPELEPLNPPIVPIPWDINEYLKLEDIAQTEGVPGYGELPYFTVEVAPETQLNDDGELATGGAYTRTYKFYIHRLPPSENSRLADKNGISVINAAEVSNNPKSLPYSPAYSAFTRSYFMVGRQAVPFAAKEVRFKVIPADDTASVYIYNISKVGDPVVTPTPDPGEEPDPSAEPTTEPTTAPTAAPTPTPTAENPTPTPTATATTGGGETGGGGTLTATGVVPLLGFGRSGTQNPTQDNPLEVTDFNEYTDPIALEARREDGSFGTNELHILVVAEAGANTPVSTLIEDAEKEQHNPDLAKFYTLYTLEIERLPASTDADLTNVVVRDINGNEQKLFNFHKDETSYTFTVPYEAEKVSFTPTLSYPTATIQLKDSGNPVHMAGVLYDNLSSGVESRTYNLNDWRGSPRTYTLIVKSEAFLDSSEPDSVKWEKGYAKEYTFTIARGAPSTDARLKRLEVSGVTEDGLSPVFKGSQLAYTATVAMGTREVTITPTVNEPHATIMWYEQTDKGGAQRVESGSATDPIELVEEHTVICVEVTAQDGTTKQTYSIDFYNPNVVELTDNADLASLRVERGLMTPEFEAAVISYEVAVKEDTWSVDIIPKPADPLATVQVLEGSREMGDYNNNYALALKDGANKVTVKVTSPDGTRTNEYNVTIYRGQEDKLKNLTPLTAEDLGEEIFKDESVNPIIISVVEYPRIHSDVFQALKDATVDDPDKTIVLQGNDFSLTFRGADLDTIIPAREIYDFSMSFSSPDADKINALVSGRKGNSDIDGEVVMVYFDYHGDLPGTATLHLTLGGKYASQPLYWHYYNRERDRIDFYGTVQSNSQGSFAVRIDHFSTYLVSRYHMIAGAEDRSGSISLSVTGVGVNGKVNPQTGIRHDAPGEKP